MAQMEGSAASLLPWQMRSKRLVKQKDGEEGQAGRGLSADFVTRRQLWPGPAWYLFQSNLTGGTPDSPTRNVIKRGAEAAGLLIASHSPALRLPSSPGRCWGALRFPSPPSLPGCLMGGGDWQRLFKSQSSGAQAGVCVFSVFKKVDNVFLCGFVLTWVRYWDPWDEWGN